MLRSFRIGNHRSFADEQELLLMPSGPADRHSVVPVTALYGANASGKSNLVNGLDFVRHAVTDSFAWWNVEGGVPRRRFRLDVESADEPSTFVVEFIAEGVPHTYGFQVDDETVLHEWLYSYPQKRKRVVFERHGEDIGIGSTIERAKSKLEVLEELTRPNALFLSAAARVDLPPLKSAYRWFQSTLRLSPYRPAVPSHTLAERVERFFGRTKVNQKRMVALLAAADVGITDVWTERIALGKSQLSAELLEIVNKVDDLQAGFKNYLPSENVRERLVPESYVRLKFAHGGDGVPFDFEEESVGTQSWLEMLLLALDALDSGHVVVVDEIDGSLHPLLTARLIGLFQDQVTNPNGAQLIFTTHDTSLLGSMLGDDVLRRDQVWFVQKSRSGASEIYPLSDFKPRKDQNTERRYLGGSYGAVPVLDPMDFVNAARAG